MVCAVGYLLARKHLDGSAKYELSRSRARHRIRRRYTLVTTDYKVSQADNGCFSRLSQAHRLNAQ